VERILSEAERQGTKVVLVGDPQQLQAIEAGASSRSIAEPHGAAEISEVRRQHQDWQCDATRWRAIVEQHHRRAEGGIPDDALALGQSTARIGSRVSGYGLTTHCDWGRSMSLAGQQASPFKRQ
jgi:hypothetical protein